MDTGIPMDGEMEALLAALDAQRAHVLGALDGLSEDQLRRPVLPSGWTALGLLNHLALDVEHYWFRCILNGESLDFFAPGPRGEADAWQVEDGVSAADVVALYRAEAARATEIIAAAVPETQPLQRDPHWGDWQLENARAVMLHVITETACHAGHLDAVRELVDGRQWLVLT